MASRFGGTMEAVPAISERSSAAPPPKPARNLLAGAATAAVAIVLAIHYFAPQPWTTTALFGLLAMAVASANLAVVQFALIAALSFGVPLLFPAYPPLVLAKGSALLVYAVLVVAIAPLRRSIDWLKLGLVPRRTWWALAAFMAVFALATAWYATRYHPPVNSHLVVGSTSRTQWLAVVLSGAALNAFFEEVFWRGAMYGALLSVTGSSRTAFLLQAVHFGCAHFRGPFYSGWVGVFGTAAFGLLTGWLRRKTGGIVLPWLVHWLCDIVLLSLIVAH